MSNTVGKAYALTTISPMKTWATYLLAIVWKLIPFFPATAQLKKLSFIHFARWVVVRPRDFPYLGAPQKRDRPAYSYLLFSSNFNGTWEQYIAAFSDVIPDGLNRIWRWSMNFPGAAPLYPFENYIRDNQIRTDHYYAAYPGSSTTDVKKAIHLQGELEKFAADSKELSPEAFATAYATFLARIQNDLSSTGLPRDGEGKPLNWSP